MQAPWRMPAWMRPLAPLLRDLELRPATVESIEAAVNLRGTFDQGDQRMVERQRIVWQLRLLTRLAEDARARKTSRTHTTEGNTP